MKNTRRVADTHRPVNKIDFGLWPVASLIFWKIEYSLDAEERIEHSQAKLLLKWDRLCNGNIKASFEFLMQISN